jgi:hypothetical protein
MDGDNEPAPKETLEQKVVKALNEIFVLHVTTVIGSAAIANADDSSAVSIVKLEPGDQKIGNTVINTLIGDSTTIYSPDFITDSALVDLHKTGVQTAQDVRNKTIDILKSLLKDFKDYLQHS